MHSVRPLGPYGPRGVINYSTVNKRGFMPGKRDDELADFIKSVIDGEGTWVSKADQIIKFKKEKRGLIGMHVSAPLDVLCGQRKVEDPDAEAEKMTHDLCLMM